MEYKVVWTVGRPISGQKALQGLRVWGKYHFGAYVSARCKRAHINQVMF